MNNDSLAHVPDLEKIVQAERLPLNAKIVGEISEEELQTNFGGGSIVGAIKEKPLPLEHLKEDDLEEGTNFSALTVQEKKYILLALGLDDVTKNYWRHPAFKQNTSDTIYFDLENDPLPRLAERIFEKGAKYKTELIQKVLNTKP